MLCVQELFSNRYLIQRHLHHGYLSDVYQAYDQHLQCDVAIKVVCHDQTESRHRLYSEIQALSSLVHDHILPILDHGTCGLYHYLVMPYFEQGTLHRRISKGMLTEIEAGRILYQVASALQYAHDHAILHRDIKPSNILICNEDDLSVYLADFGLAKAISAGSEITQTGCLIGTPDYMAPELIEEPESVSSDIYSLGILLYHMLTGQTPFSGTTPIALLWKHVREQPIPPSQLNPAITPPIERVILRALHKNPKQRFLSAQALSQAYANALQLSQQTKAPLGFPIFESQPVMTTPKKVDEKVLPAIAQQPVAIERSRNSSSTLRRAILVLALLAMFIVPLSFGFMVGRERIQVTPASNALQFATSLHKSTLGGAIALPTPDVTPPSSAPLVLPSKANPNPHHQAPSKVHRKHKHQHQKHDSNDTIELDA